MKITSGHLGSITLMALLAFCLLLIANETFAMTGEPVSQDGKIEVIYPTEKSSPYRDRRGNWSTIFAVNVDQMMPEKYRSPLTSDSYTDLFGETPIKLLQIEIGGKANFVLGSFGASLIYGSGSVADSRGQTGPGDQLKLTKVGGSLTYTMDNLFQEPYVAPYVQAQMYQMSWNETRNDSTSKEGTTSYGSALSMGMLFQLNWLDPSSAVAAMDSVGLENTYVDLFVSQYGTSNSEEDPDFQTDLNYGAGIRFEF